MVSTKHADNCAFALLILLVLFSSQVTFSQVVRTWDYSFNPVSNYESSGSCITALPSGKTFSGGIFRNRSGFSTKNILLLTDETGTLLDVDTSTLGAGYKKVFYNGNSDVFAAATLQNDSLPISKIVVAKVDTTFANKRFFVPDSGTTFPGYDVLDFCLLSNTNMVVGSHWDAFPLVCLSLMCMDSSGNKMWERVDSTFQFSYDVKLLADSNGGIFVAGSGRDPLSSYDFIFVSHYTSMGFRDWSFRYYSPAHFFADLTDIIQDVTGHLYISGAVMDVVGQVGFLMKVDQLGNVLWNKQILPLSYSRILSTSTENIYGATVPLNGSDVFTLDKLDSSGTKTDSASFVLQGYFASELGDLRIVKYDIIVATGGVFVASFPKSDLFLAAFDTSLNLLGFDIFDSLNMLGENGKALAEGSDGSIYACGRLNYENQFETSNIGLIKYDISGIINAVLPVNRSAFEIFPNPSFGTLNFRCTNSYTGNMIFRIVNSTGADVFNKIISGDDLFQISNLSLSPGFYFAILETNLGREVHKVCVLE